MSSQDSFPMQLARKFGKFPTSFAKCSTKSQSSCAFSFQKMVDFSNKTQLVSGFPDFLRQNNISSPFNSSNGPLSQVVGPKCRQGLGHPSRGVHCTKPLESGWFGWRWKIYRSKVWSFKDPRFSRVMSWCQQVVEFLSANFVEVGKEVNFGRNHPPFHHKTTNLSTLRYTHKISPTCGEIFPLSNFISAVGYPELPRWKFQIPKIAEAPGRVISMAMPRCLLFQVLG